ncbi:MAG: Quercetin 2,3-dioxygenase [Myxococcota bacterium]|nr:Quercetin 2,3-dioxygenase [Myxococcota bacterium]
MMNRRRFLGGIGAGAAAGLIQACSFPANPLSAPATAPQQEFAMLKLIRSNDRGYADHGWLKTHHSFSFAGYYNPEAMGFRALRVINEDFVKEGRGFPTHPHRDMEIITYVLDGELEHRDSMGNGSIIHPGEVQRMTAGTGVTHSEYNPSREKPVHLLQIWILPEKEGLQPGYEQKHFPDAEKHGRFRVIASRNGQDGSVVIHQDARLLAAKLDAGQETSFPLSKGRHAWVHVARGSIELNGHKLGPGDAAAVTDEGLLNFRGAGASEVLLFDLA